MGKVWIASIQKSPDTVESEALQVFPLEGCLVGLKELLFSLHEGGAQSVQIAGYCKGTVGSEAGDLSEPAVRRKSHELMTN